METKSLIGLGLLGAALYATLKPKVPVFTLKNPSDGNVKKMLNYSQAVDLLVDAYDDIRLKNSSMSQDEITKYVMSQVGSVEHGFITDSTIVDLFQALFSVNVKFKEAHIYYNDDDNQVVYDELSDDRPPIIIAQFSGKGGKFEPYALAIYTMGRIADLITKYPNIFDSKLAKNNPKKRKKNPIESYDSVDELPDYKSQTIAGWISSHFAGYELMKGGVQSGSNATADLPENHRVVELYFDIPDTGSLREANILIQQVKRELNNKMADLDIKPLGIIFKIAHLSSGEKINFRLYYTDAD